MHQAPSDQTSLLFVYNADTGLFNTLADIGHKIFSPSTYSCDLCMLTHGYFSEREAWRAFVEQLPMSAEFLHRDEFRARYPQTHTPLPAVFVRDGDTLKLCAGAQALADCRTLDDLKQLVSLACDTSEA